MTVSKNTHDTDGNKFTSTFDENGCVPDRLGRHARAHIVLARVIDGRRAAERGGFVLGGE